MEKVKRPSHGFGEQGNIPIGEQGNIPIGEQGNNGKKFKGTREQN